MKFNIYEYRSDFGTKYSTVLISGEDCVTLYEAEVDEAPDYELGYTVCGDPCIVYDGFTFTIDEAIGKSSKNDLFYLTVLNHSGKMRRIKVHINEWKTKQISTRETI